MEYRMKLSSLAAALALACALPATAAESYTIDGVHSQPWFEVNHHGFSLQRGHFTKLTGGASLDLASKSGSVKVSIDVASVDMGLPVWSEQVKEKFFDAAKFPAMSFESERFVFDGETPVAVEGRFTLRGVTRPLSLKVTNFKCGTNPFNKKALCGAEITASFKRSDFGMSYGLAGIGDEVKITVPLEAYRVAP